MKKIMQIALGCLLAISTTAYAGDNRQCSRSGSDKTCSSACQAACKKTCCDKSCNTACTKQKCGMKKS